MSILNGSNKMNAFKNTFMNTLITTKLGLDTLPVRLGAGVIFTAHGAQKLFGWFGGYGLEGTAGWMESIGLAPGTLMAAAAGGAEFFGGLLLIAGLLVRPTAWILAITMLVAIITVHLQNGLFMSNNGYEFGLALLVISVGLAIRGAGSMSVDNLLQKKLANA
jgi:putative oxidoreductase